MIETMFPIDIPPGIVMNGTLDQRAGRWSDGNLVRFLEDGSPAAMRGSSALVTNVTIPGGTPHAAFAWSGRGESAGIANVVVGTSSKLYVIAQALTAPSTTHTVTDITPSAFFNNTGLLGTFGFATLDDIVLVSRAGSIADIEIWSWDPVAGGTATKIPITGGTSGGVFVTPESFVVVIQNDRDIIWASQGTLDEFDPNGTNSAGALTLSTMAGKLMRGLVVRGQTLVWSTQNLGSLNYVGGDLIYGFSVIASGCGLMAPNCVSVANDTAYWMGHDGFFEYDGYVRPLQCDIQEYIFGNINRLVRDRFFTVHMENEIRWHYCSSGANTPDRVAIYNTVLKAWSKGTISRMAGTDAIWPQYSSGTNKVPVPIMFEGTSAAFFHDLEGTVASGAYIESGPLKLGEGDQLMRVQKIIPDGARFPAVSDTITIFAGTWPQVAETSNTYDLFTLTNGTAGPIDARFSARYIRYKQTLVSSASRIGIPQLGLLPGSRR